MNDSTPTRRLSSTLASNQNKSPSSIAIIGSSSNLNKQKSISITSISSNASDNSGGSGNSDSPYQSFLIKRVSTKSGLFQKSFKKITHSPDEFNISNLNANKGSIDNFRRVSLRGTNLFQDRTNTLNDIIKNQRQIPIFNLKDCPQEIENENKENSSHQHKLIKHSLEIDAKCRNLIGDRSSELVLPTLCSNIKHPDLNCITPETLVDVLNGGYKEQIDEIILIDSRYPYEYDGGHIKSALNIYTQEQLGEEMFQTRLYFNSNPARKLLSSRSISCFSPPNKHLAKHNASSIDAFNKSHRKIVIFHCEFSSERGPTLLRFLRKLDRHLNQNTYPNLYYPELYLLEGGYKDFYAKFKTYCSPCNYVLMFDPNYSEQLKHYRSISKKSSLNSERCSRLSQLKMRLLE